MIFVDASVLEAAIRTADPRGDQAQKFFLRCLDLKIPLCTSAADLLDLTMAGSGIDLPHCRLFELVRGRMVEIWPLEADDILHADQMRPRFPKLQQRALVTLAACRRRGVGGIHTFDPALRHASRLGSRGTSLTGRQRARFAQIEWRAAREKERQRELDTWLAWWRD